MLMSVHSTSPLASSRSLVSSGNARSPCVVHTPSARDGGITCQMASSMLAVAPNSKARRTSLADRSVCRTPGANCCCTSTIARSVMRLALRRQAIWSGVLTRFAAPTTTAASEGGPPGKIRSAARHIAPVISSTATLAPRGISSPITRPNCWTPSSNSRYSGSCRWSAGTWDSDEAPSRNGMNRCGCSSSASTIATGRSTCDRPASSTGQLAPVAYTTLSFINRINASTPWSAIAARSLELVSRCIRSRSGSSGMTKLRTLEEAVISDTQELLDVAADDADGVVRADSFDDGGQRFLRVAEAAFVVRVIGRPHHLVDADLLDQLQAERVHDERGTHVGVPVVLNVVLQRVIQHVLIGSQHVLGVLQRRWNPGDAALEPADPQARMAVEDAAKDILGEHLPESVDVHHHRDRDVVDLAGRLRRGFADVMRHRQAGFLDRLPDRSHRAARIVHHDAVVAIARVERQQERLEAQRFQLDQGPLGTVGIPPVDQAHAEEVAVRAFLQIGNVLVVDAENPLAHWLIGKSEHGQKCIGKSEFAVHAVLAQFAYPRFDVVGGGPGQVVVLHQHGAEDVGQKGLSLMADLVGAVFVPDPRRIVFEVVGKAFVEDVGGQRDVGVGGEHFGA